MSRNTIVPSFIPEQIDRIDKASVLLLNAVNEKADSATIYSLIDALRTLTIALSIADRVWKRSDTTEKESASFIAEQIERMNKASALLLTAIVYEGADSATIRSRIDDLRALASETLNPGDTPTQTNRAE